MDYQTLKQNQVQFLALTTLLPEEFDDLLAKFTPHWETYYRYRTLSGAYRKQPIYEEHGNATLKGTATKLLFLLTYLKTNALQQSQAFSFGISQTKVSRIAGVLLEILNQTLAQAGLLPIRNAEQLATSLRAHPEKVFTYDGLERGILRNTDHKGQEAEYSGKKKGHRLKNNVLCDDAQRIHYLSPTELGATHDKKIADEYPLSLPEHSVLRQDLGFLGHLPGGVLVEMPHKKPRNKDLIFSQLLYNQMLSRLRVVIEHVNSGIKRLRMLKDPIRLRDEWFRDTVLVVGCGLHNFRVASSQRAYGSHGRKHNQFA